MKSKAEKQAQAFVRQTEREARGVAGQLALIEKRPGQSAQERAKLAKASVKQ